MKPTIYLLIVLVFILLGSCNTKNDTLEESFEKKLLKGEEVPIKNGFFANPFGIEIVDTVMLILDKYNDKYFMAIDIKNKSAINRFGVEGRGPNELSYPLNLIYNKEERLVSFCVRNPTRHWSIKIDDLTKPDITFIESVNPKCDMSTARFFNIIPIQNSNGKYFGTGMFAEGMYGICQSDGTLDTIIGSYTVAEEHNTIGAYILGSGYQGFIKPHPKASLIAYASSCHDLIEVIDCSNNNYIIKRFHRGDFPDFKVIDGFMAISRYSPLPFLELFSTEKFIYTLYSGKTFNEYSNMAGQGKLLYVFDWNLSPIICYDLD